LELLESRAKYVLRNEVIDAVVMANPILKAVHGGTEAAPVERFDPLFSRIITQG
jgi:hypothetical protein